MYQKILFNQILLFSIKKMKKHLISKVKDFLELFDKHNIKNKNQEKSRNW